MKKKLVIGSARGYSWNLLEPFVRSFVKFVHSADLVLFVDEISDFTRHCLETASERIKLEAFPADLKSGFVVNNRWKIFLRYIEEHGEYEQIFITDTRDVIFQGDIFSEFAGEKNFLGYAIEYDTVLGTRTDEAINYIWLARDFGRETADKFADREIICCGTVIGTPEEMKIFLRAMVKYNPNQQGLVQDQSTMQYIMYNNLLPLENLIGIDCVTGAILTSYLFHFALINSKNFSAEVVRNGMILRGDGKVPAVVHQYDRYPPFIELADFFYRAKDFQFDENFTDIHSVQDQFIQLASVGKFGEAANIFYEYLFEKTDFENRVDKIFRFWQKLLKMNDMPLTVEWEIIELTFQHAVLLKFSNGVDLKLLGEIIGAIENAQEKNRPVSSLLKTAAYQIALQFLNFCSNSGDFGNSKQLIEKVETLHYPFTKELYLFKAETYRALGEYVEAEAAYKRAKEFD